MAGPPRADEESAFLQKDYFFRWKVVAQVLLQVLLRRGQFEDFNKLVVAYNLDGFPRPPPGAEVFDVFGAEDHVFPSAEIFSCT